MSIQNKTKQKPQGMSLRINLLKENKMTKS